MDVWSVGCTVYELITGKPLFKAGNYQDLIKMFIKVLGKPDKESLAFISNEHALKFILDMPDMPRRKPTEGVTYSNPLVLDLIDKCLEFNPNKRISVEAALAHPYLKALHDPNDEPSFNQNVDFDFEIGDKKLADLKRVILEDINIVNKHNKEDIYDVAKIMSKHP